ncbi:YfbK domain-containing protein [Hymenobacter lucidus]|uniref:von Willebrand factor type A domain-containing protein n=1 Tax=Hymenobacter lucidus TaxID=2880930 RepID=A0ABS8AL92_9BACT|nr:von Willebrand factor type A domain-containing protein [Hymenobacter lucidus]MCB2406413.1 von Willebrand factor type A domain-containing protein [Hymenobacter lucidus]
MNKLFVMGMSCLLAAPAQAQPLQAAPPARTTQTSKPAATRVVQGRILDGRTSQGVPGAEVRVKGTSIVTTSNPTGTYRLLVPKGPATLVVSALGYGRQERPVPADGKLDIKLAPDSKELSEVVVTATAPEPSKRQVSGAVSEVKAAAVAGKVAGVRSSGQVPAGRMQKRKSERNAPVAADVLYDSAPPRPVPGAGESYAAIKENGFHTAQKEPLSTFSIDVDAASYSNVRRFLNQGQRPPQDAVRVEEMLNYFHYDYPQPTGSDPFSVTTELAVCPWNAEHQLLHVALQGRQVSTRKLPPANLVFLVDVSGSMNEPDKLPLVQAGLRQLVQELRPQDKVAIVVYAGAAGLVLPATPGNQKADILAALDRLSAGGSTAGGAGLRLAYQVAREQFQKEGNNRVILATDGDFNVGESSDDAMERLITEERESGVFLTVLGVGQGNLQDSKMERLADKGNGNYAYLDNLDEARRVLVRQFGGTLFTLAKDVKLQLEFNPARVQQYRLIGYENRALADEDFNNDRKDAGELGAGHTVTALYELIPPGAPTGIDALKYQQNPAPRQPAPASADVMTVKLRYKEPQGLTSRLLERTLRGPAKSVAQASDNLRFAAAVAQFGMLLRQSDYRGTATYGSTEQLAQAARGTDADGYRAEFVRLVKLAEGLSPVAGTVGAR